MMALVTGGSASGKSVIAERLACCLSPRRLYLATMAPQGKEALERIERHRLQRAGRGFRTIECTGSLPVEQIRSNDATQDVVLIDDLGNLVADALFLPDGTMADVDEVARRIESEVLALRDACAHLVLVGNEVGGAGPAPYETTNTWVRLMGTLACRLAARCDLVIEAVVGRPHLLKGDLPWAC